MATALNIITGAFRKLSAYDSNQGLQPEETDLGFDTLNALLDAWSLDRLYAYAVTEVVALLPPGTTTRTIGPGQQINIDRPIRLEVGGFTRSSGVDYPFQVISYETYASIAFKSSASTWPEAVYFDGGLPTGTLYFYPPTAGQSELHMPVMTRLAKFADLNTDYTLPPGYEKALIYCLAEEIASDLSRPVPDVVAKIAATSRKAIKRANVTIPTLTTCAPYQRFNILGNR